ncbi:MAG: hypothetical protein AB3N20_08630 [Rhizobiaceae bacterium]
MFVNTLGSFSGMASGGFENAFYPADDRAFAGGHADGVRDPAVAGRPDDQ